MSKVTSKYQVTLPRKIARAHRIAPGSDIAFVSNGESLRVLVDSGVASEVRGGRTTVLESYDEASARQAVRNRRIMEQLGDAEGRMERGWTRDDLYSDRLGRL